MSLAAINSQYAGLNGLYGTNTFGFCGGYGSTNIYANGGTETAKDNLDKMYDVNAHSRSLNNRDEASSASFSQQAQALQYLLANGRTDDAAKQFDVLYQNIASNPNFDNYDDNMIKTELQNQYMNATGTTIIRDINANSDGAFATGFKSSIPLIGFACNSNSSDAFVAKATNTRVSNASKAKEIAGVAVGVGTASAGAAGLSILARGIKNASSSGSFLTALKNARGKGKIAAIVAGVVALGTYIVNKVTN